MSYNRENFNRIKQEYEDKYIRAREIAEMKRFQIHSGTFRNSFNKATTQRLQKNCGQPIFSDLYSPTFKYFNLCSSAKRNAD